MGHQSQERGQEDSWDHKSGENVGSASPGFLAFLFPCDRRPALLADKEVKTGGVKVNILLVPQHCFSVLSCLFSLMLSFTQGQFVATAAHSSYNLFTECSFPDGLDTVGLLSTFSVIGLFLNCYHQTHLRSKREKLT